MDAVGLGVSDRNDWIVEYVYSANVAVRVLVEGVLDDEVRVWVDDELNAVGLVLPDGVIRTNVWKVEG